MRHNDQELGKPTRLYRGTTVELAALSLSAVDDAGVVAFDTTQDIVVVYDGAEWRTTSGVLSVYNASGTLNLTTSYQDVPDVTTGAFTPEGNEYAWVYLNILVNQGAGTAACNASDALYAALYNAANELDAQAFVASGNVGTLMFTRWIQVSLTADTEYTLKMRAKNNTGNRGRVVASSQMLVYRIRR